MIEFYFIRHGESQGNKENRFRGRHDFLLNENGIRQAEALREALSGVKFETIISSPLKRASKTAEIISAGRVPVQIDEHFNNIALGSWENMPKDEVRYKYPDLWEIWRSNPEQLNFPGMETLAQVRVRSLNRINEILESDFRGKVAIVTHRAVLKPLIAGILNIPEPYFWKIHVDTASYSIAEYNMLQGFTFTLINEHCHLQEFIREDLG